MELIDLQSLQQIVCLCTPCTCIRTQNTHAWTHAWTQVSAYLS